MDFASSQQQNTYTVEVSGWDASEAFFVENTALTWTAEGIKEISLRRPVREGSVIFVRLTQPMATADNCPVACTAVKVIERGPGGDAVVQLTQLSPRALFKKAARDAECSPTKVAQLTRLLDRSHGKLYCQSTS